MSCSSITENVYHPPTQSSQSGFSVWSTLQITLTPDLMCNISALGVASDSAVRVQTIKQGGGNSYNPGFLARNPFKQGGNSYRGGVKRNVCHRNWLAPPARDPDFGLTFDTLPRRENFATFFNSFDRNTSKNTIFLV